MQPTTFDVLQSIRDNLKDQIVVFKRRKDLSKVAVVQLEFCWSDPARNDEDFKLGRLLIACLIWAT